MKACTLHNARHRNSGFTLVEVLAAMAILGTAMFVLLDAHYTALKLHETMQEEVILRQLIESVTARAEVEVLMGNTDDSGDFGMRYPDFTWSFNAELLTREEVPLYSVRASVEGPLESRDMQFYVFNVSPESAQNGDSMFNNSRRGTPGTTGRNANQNNTGNRRGGGGGGLF
jgi:prepilin-type N-terminal cleavage/methylation domain-containing protein